MHQRFERIFTRRVRVRLAKGRKVYEITIPKDTAESLGLKRGDYIEVGIRKVSPPEKE